MLTPTVTPRLAAPRYRLQIELGPELQQPAEDHRHGQRILHADQGPKAWPTAPGTGASRCCRMPIVQARRLQSGPALLQGVPVADPDSAPPQGSSTSRSPQFEWAPLAGAAYYRIQIANNELFNRRDHCDDRHDPLHAHGATETGRRLLLARADDRRRRQARPVRAWPRARRQHGVPAGGAAVKVALPNWASI